jgi:hypothetical protein
MKTILTALAAASALSFAAPASASPEKDDAAQSAELRSQLEDGISSGKIEPYEANPLRKSLRKLTALETRFAADGVTDKESGTLRKRSAELRRQIGKAARTDVREDRRADAEDRRARRAASDERRAAKAEDRQARRAASAERRSREAATDDRQRLAADEKSERRAAADERQDAAAVAVSTARFDGPSPADRFAGDVRIGQAASPRMVAVPERYRDEFRDTDQFYYLYDDKRIYRMDRVTGLVLALLDT